MTPADHTFAVCAYGESPYLDECVASLKDQSVSTSIIICTSTPNDGIRSVADRHQVPLFESENPPGIASDWNHAIKRAATPLVTVAHQDDVYEPQYVHRMLRAMSELEKPLLYFTDYGELRQGERVRDSRLLRVKRHALASLRDGRNAASVNVRHRALSLGNPICCPSVTFALCNLPSPVFLDGFKSNLDWEAWSRIAEMEGDFYYDAEILLYHRIHTGSETSALISDDTRTKEDLQMLKRFWPAPLAYLINLAYRHGQASNRP